MRKALVLAFAALLATLAAASGARAAAPGVSLAQAVKSTEHVATLRYVMTIALARKDYAPVSLHIDGMRTRTSLAINVQQMSASMPGPRQSALIDGPFLYEGSPNGVAVQGTIRWLRVPVARIGRKAPALSAVRDLSPSPLLHVLDEWTHARAASKSGSFSGSVAYDDPIVLGVLSAMTHGIAFRDLRFAAHAGPDGYLHSIRITGKTADGQRTLGIEIHMFAFGRPIRVKVPGEGTFMDQKLLDLEE